MTVVGKIFSEGTLNVFGRVEGELDASIVRISDGAEVEGTIAAQELTIGGRFKGTIQADRVMLTRVELIKSTIQVRQRGRQRPGNLAPACRSGLRCV